VVFLLVAGGIAPAGSLRRQTARTLLGTVSPAATLRKLITRALSGGIQPGADVAAVDASLKPTAVVVSHDELNTVVQTSTVNRTQVRSGV
jgi:hypothetical protein